MKQTFKIITLGCKVNQYESAYLNTRFQAAGWIAVPRSMPSDVTIINTCIVTQTASHQSRQEIRKAVRENHDGYVAAIGCYGQAFPEELEAIEGLRFIAGNRAKGSIPDVFRAAIGQEGLTDCRSPFPREMRFEDMAITSFPGRSRAFLKIQDGCQSFCSYCIVPFSRGPYRSLPPERVLKTLEDLSAGGYREVVLTGIHLGKYGVDLAGSGDLTDLLRAIGGRSLPLRIRISSMEPGEIDDELIEMVASEEWLCRHFHIPLQSGDDRVLRKMNRTYTTGSFARLVKAIHEKIPYAAIGADVMTGFPGEDPQAHANTMDLLRDLPVSYLHVFPYSRRPGTSAAGFPGQVTPKEKKERAARLRALGKSKRKAFHDRCVGKDFQVVVEGAYAKGQGHAKGISDNYITTVFPLSRLNKGGLVSVRMEKVDGAGMRGRVQNGESSSPDRA